MRLLDSRCWFFLVATGLALVGSAHATTLTVDPTTTYQTIVGFGCHNPGGQLTRLVNDLGMSVHRDDIGPDGSSATGFSTMKGLADLGVKNFIATPWSPPAHMKTNNNTRNSGSLKPSAYDDFADWLIGYARRFKQQVGLPLYSISPQNEPQFVETYRSCVYSAVQYRDMMRVLGPKMAASGLSTRINIAEDMLRNFGPYIIATTSDSIAGRYVDAISVHGYVDGVKPASSRRGINLWASVWKYVSNLTEASGREIMTMQTETSGYVDQWENGPMTTWKGETIPDAPGGLGLGADILVALKYGHVSVWCYWRCTNQRYYRLVDDGVYEGSKQFYKFIRPGDVNIKSTLEPSDDQLLDVAFVSKDGNTLTIVLVNLSEQSKGVSLSGSGIRQTLMAYRSSTTEKCVAVGTMDKNDIILPKRSITTLVAPDYNPVTTSSSNPLLGARSASLSLAAQLYTLDGRRLGAGAPARGVVVRARRDLSGRAQRCLGVRMNTRGVQDQ